MTANGDSIIENQTMHNLSTQQNSLSQHNLIIPDWPAPKIVQAGCTTRHAFQGKSLLPFHSFNVANHVGDNTEYVAANRQQLPFPDIAWLQQTHSTTIVHILRAEDCGKPVNADASFTTLSEVTCAVMTADCLPILLCDAHGRWVAAIHAGWRGLAAGIVEKALSTLNSKINQGKARGFKKGSTLAWIGPAIGRQAFEVREEVKLAFTANNSTAIKAFQAIQGEPGKYRCDLAAICKDKMANAGVKQIFGGDFCTYQDETRFFSHRRDAKINGTTGRMASLIYLRPE